MVRIRVHSPSFHEVLVIKEALKRKDYLFFAALVKL